MTEYILKLVAIENSVSSITAVETHSIKTMQFSLSIAVHTSGVAQKINIGSWRRKKRKLENNLIW